MSVSRISALAFGVVVLVSLLAIWLYPSGHDYMRENPFWNGLSDVSEEMDITLSNTSNDVLENPENMIMVEISYSSYTENELDMIAEFVGNGGVLILADDYGNGNNVAEKLGIEARFSGSELLDPLFCYKNPWLPKVTEFSDELREAGIESVALNHATALTDVKSAQVLAWSSASSFLDANGNGALDEGETRGPLPIAAELSANGGTVILITDPSIFINSMMGKDDNRAFLTYLTSDPGSHRETVMDVSRLPKSHLDGGKAGVDQARTRLSHPYSVMAVLGVVIMLVLRPWKGKELIYESCE